MADDFQIIYDNLQSEREDASALSLIPDENPAAQEESPAPVVEPTQPAELKTNPTDEVFSIIEKTLNLAEGKPIKDTPKEPSMSVGKDVALGTMQAPRSVARGVVGATKESLDIMGDISAEINSLLPLPVLQLTNAKGELDVDVLRSSTYEALVKKGEMKSVFNAASEAVPQLDKPKIETVTGNAIEGISQFVTGFFGAGKLAPIKAISTGTKAGKIGKAAAQGVVGDVIAFDEHEQRLSNVVESVPALRNPVTEYLQAEGDDTFIEGKFKQAAEGVLGAAVGEALFRGVKAIKGYRKASIANPSIEPVAPALEKNQFNFLGDVENQALILEKKVTQEAQGVISKGKKAAKETEGVTVTGKAPEERAFQINFARINGAEDVKALMDEMVNNPKLVKSIQQARRGVKDERATLTAANDINGFDELLGRRTGQAFNAEQIVAARKVYYDTTEKLMESAKLAASPNASMIDQYNFRKMLAVHQAVQKEFMGVRAEAGRALQAWKINVGGNGQLAYKEMQEILNNFGGQEASQVLANKISQLGTGINTTQINAIADKGALARTVDAVSSVWTKGLLTNPTTHAVNTLSNVGTGLLLGMERMASSVMGKNIPIQEGVAYFQGYISAQREGLKNAAQAFRSGEAFMGGNKFETPRIRAEAQDVLDPNKTMGFLTKGLDWYGKALETFSTKLLAAGDSYSKTVAYKSQTYALSAREGVAKGLKGKELKQFIADSVNNPSNQLDTAAIEFAEYGTFQKELGRGGQAIQRLISDNPALRFVVPFVKTPINIFKFTFERTPLATLSKKIRDDISAGGVRKDMALTKMAVGTSSMMIAVDMAMNGQITGAGPVDPKLRQTLLNAGWQPYSIKIGDKYYSYGRFEPVATLFGMGADLAEILGNYEAYDVDQQETVEKVGLAAMTAIANQVVGKTFLSGMADTMEVLSDPQRYGQNFLSRFSGSLVPAGVAGIERAIDPQTEFVFNELDAIKSRIPGLSDQVPNKLNVWGEEVKAFYPSEHDLESIPERIFSLVNPSRYSKGGESPLDTWIARNGFYSLLDMPDKKQGFSISRRNPDKVKVDLTEQPEMYARFVKLRGGEVTLRQYGGLTMKEFFTELADGNSRYSRSFFNLRLDNDNQQAFISKVISDYTEAAKDQLRQEFPEIETVVQSEALKTMNESTIKGIEGLVKQKPIP